jgi:hypothetical protein
MLTLNPLKTQQKVRPPKVICIELKQLWCFFKFFPGSKSFGLLFILSELSI